MSIIKDGWVTRDGFKCAYGRFVTESPYNLERIEGSRLKELFIPRLTKEANKLLRDHRHFVRGQLQHYGVEYSPDEYKGEGTNLLKKALAAGKVRICRNSVNA
jgi:hypothetical protein